MFWGFSSLISHAFGVIKILDSLSLKLMIVKTRIITKDVALFMPVSFSKIQIVASKNPINLDKRMTEKGKNSKEKK